MSRGSLQIVVPALSAAMLLALSTTTQAGATTASVTPTLASTGTQAAAATPVSFVASSTSSANVMAPAVTVPGSTQAGDTLVLTASLGNATAVSASSGWTLKGDRNATAALRSAVWTRTATAADAGASVAVTMETIHKSVLVVSVYRDVDPTQPVTATAITDSATTSHSTPAVSVAHRAQVVSFWAERGPSTTRWTVPSSETMRASGYSTGNGRVSAAVADDGAASSGAVAGSTATTDATSTLGVSWSIVLPMRNTPPTAAFTQSCTGGVCSFDASGSTDPDGTISSFDWSFGDGKTGSASSTSHTYTTAGDFPVQLTVTDDSGAATTFTNTVTAQRATVFGMNVSPGTSFTNGVRETAAQQVSRITSTYGGLGVAKVFYQGNLPATFNTAYEGLVPGKVAAVCFKPDQTALANGSLDASIRQYVNSIPADWKILLVNWQEPDDEIWVDHLFTAAQHRAADEHLIDVVRANPAYAADRAEVWGVWMGYSLDVGRWQDAAASPRLDGIGWDYYWNKPTTDWSTDPNVALKKMADKTRVLGIKDLGLFETGDNPHLNDVDGSGRAAFWTKVYDGTQSLGYHYVMYFNAIGTTGDHRILPGTAFGDPMVAMVRGRMAVR